MTISTIIRDARLFPTLIAALSLIAGISYFIHKDWGRGIYWTATTVIVFAATFLISSGR